jgi:hypothetical protein
LIGADHDMMLILNACAPNNVSANKCLFLTKMDGYGFPRRLREKAVTRVSGRTSDD